MRFSRVHIESVACALPEERVASEDLERELGPLYERLGLHVGRLELMSGIRERRFWPPGTRPSEVATRAGELALERSGVARERIGCLVHASVCRDFLEPATASVVHARLGLPETAWAFDLSNACLGFAHAMVVVGGLIERGEIEAIRARLETVDPHAAELLSIRGVFVERLLEIAEEYEKTDRPHSAIRAYREGLEHSPDDAGLAARIRAAEPPGRSGGEGSAP